MPFSRFALPALALLAACVSPQTQGVVPSQCAGAAPYAGPSLRAGGVVDASGLSPARGSGLTQAERDRLTQAFATARRATGAESLSVAVWQSGGDPWVAQHRVGAGQLHYWASVGKIVTAAAILRLEEMRKLSLDDPISDYVPGVPLGDAITLRMLMAHSSGLFSLNEDPDLSAQGMMTLPEVLSALSQKPLYACPGAVWRYSNTGYTLLGAVIEAVTGQPYATAAEDLVLARSRADTIRVLSRRADLSNIVPLGAGAEPGFDIRAPQAAGGIVADAQSMALFLRDLLAGRIVSRAHVALMTRTLYPMFDQGLWYGLGMMVYDVPSADGAQLWIGHSGGVPGAKAIVAYAPDLDAIAAVALTGGGSAEATAHLLFKALDGGT
ncbi:serine hydrolase domain-containing protein [Roseibaca sp. Y0-43]|uniref:serine hydrolase domain-containing protein n=1 Tax=Roseibaca sp. Y0-43 TaxID=2816854 RepID=UPI001D0BF9B2|nr:serine hydrolase domain-containing protein [Roseibaca sp. Y0-43]MCC1480450.1 beta-lactamase family protein [Roseibaca sp. Y0-43]